MLSKSSNARILSVGTSVPDHILTNKDLETLLDTSDEWISTRTGIKQRRVYPRGKDRPAWELGSQAARKALEKAKLTPDLIDGVICATFTPDYFFPSTACKIADSVGIRDAFAFDISAACAGFVYGLAIAHAMIGNGRYRRILLVGAEVISKTLNWQDRSTAILFGDGAGAVIVDAAPDNSQGLLSSWLSSDGALGDILQFPAWGDNRRMTMKGSEVFKHAVRMMSEATVRVVREAGYTLEDVDLLIPHQANMRILNSIADNLSFPTRKVISNLVNYGNTSSASIPLALEHAWETGRIVPGALVAFTSLGGGLAVGSALVRF
ncbi:MAG: beta-ketoacyl-ACP synthase III [Chitinivibrionales bacterium]|nr:beta-ketoacyl-ACP synthase III [Chitinivibrionales bacterium]